MAGQNEFMRPLNRRAFTAWAERAACKGADPSLFFPEQGHPSNGAIKMYCNYCPVRQECLDYSIRNGEWYGVWGGVGEKKRRLMIELYKLKHYVLVPGGEDGSSNPTERGPGQLDDVVDGNQGA